MKALILALPLLFFVATAAKADSTDSAGANEVSCRITQRAPLFSKEEFKHENLSGIIFDTDFKVTGVRTKLSSLELKLNDKTYFIWGGQVICSDQNGKFFRY